MDKDKIARSAACRCVVVMETDWKKKYEEALNKARELNGTVAAGRDFLAEIFPELAESEDERIRKHIVTFIMEADRRGEAPEECAKCLAYLEKQKMEGNFRCAKVNDEPIPSEPHSVNLPKGVEINGVPESEDERARMWLYDYIFNCPNENFAFYGGVGKQAVLAWLEKQKDNKFAPRVLPCSAAWFEDGEERQKEQKPNYCHYGGDPNVERCKLCSAVCIGRLTEDQKPVEWSEVELEFRGEKVKVKRPFFRDDKGRGYSTTEQDEDVAWDALRAWCEKKGIAL